MKHYSGKLTTVIISILVTAVLIFQAFVPAGQTAALYALAETPDDEGAAIYVSTISVKEVTYEEAQGGVALKASVGYYNLLPEAEYKLTLKVVEVENGRTLKPGSEIKSVEAVLKTGKKGEKAVIEGGAAEGDTAASGGQTENTSASGEADGTPADDDDTAYDDVIAGTVTVDLGIIEGLAQNRKYAVIVQASTDDERASVKTFDDQLITSGHNMLVVGRDETLPYIDTTVRARDAIDRGQFSVASDFDPARCYRDIEYVLNKERKAEIEKEEKELEAAQKKAAKEEAAKLAAKLVKDRRHLEVMGEKNAYQRYEWMYADPPEEDVDPYDPDEEDMDAEDDETDTDDSDSGDDTDDIDDSDDDSYDYDEEDEDEYDPDDDSDYDQGSDADDLDEEPSYSLEDYRYYKAVIKDFPMLSSFWFEKDGSYHYEYNPDYSSIDYSDLYTPVEHYTFEVIDELKYNMLTPGKTYKVTAKLTKLSYDYETSAEGMQMIPEETAGEGQDAEKAEGEGQDTAKAEAELRDTAKAEGEPKLEVIKEITYEFTADESGKGSFDLEFGDLELEYGQYVVTCEVVSEDGEEKFVLDDLYDTKETLMITTMPDINMAKASAADGRGRSSGSGKIEFPDDTEIAAVGAGYKGGGNGAPKTGDESGSIALYVLIALGAFLLAAAGPLKSARLCCILHK